MNDKKLFECSCWPLSRPFWHGAKIVHHSKLADWPSITSVVSAIEDNMPSIEFADFDEMDGTAFVFLNRIQGYYLDRRPPIVLETGSS